MLRTAALVPVLIAGLLIALFASTAATHTARSKQADRATARVTPARPAALDASSGKATVTSSEYAFSASAIDAPAGKLKLTLANAGAIEHELVVLQSPADPGSLKIDAKGRVSEAASVGEISETKAGASKSTTFDLKPGRYVYVCNIPGHYGSGMRGVLVVK